MDYPYQYAALVLDGRKRAESSSQIGIKFDGTESFTIDAWVKLDEAIAKKTIISQKDGFSLGLDGKRMFFQISGFPSAYSRQQEDAFAPGEWVHLCAVYDTSAITLYINGVSDTYVAIGGTGSSTAEPFFFGENLSGALRYVRIFHCALHSDQVTAYLMQTDLDDNIFRGLLAAYYDFSKVPAQERIKEQKITLEDAGMQQLFSTGAMFEGNSFLTIDGEPDINPAGQGNDSYTIQSWIFLQPNEFEKRHTIFSNGDINGRAGMSLFIEQEEGGYYVKGLRANGTDVDDIVVSSASVQPNQWINIAVTYDVDTMKLYVGGKLSNTLAGLFPIPVNLYASQPRIGSEVLENDVNGQDWMTGCISRLDIWERALCVDEIVRYAGEAPEVDTQTLLASYSFHQKDASNSCNGKLLGEHNGLIFSEVGVKVAQGLYFQESGVTDMENDAAVYAEPLQSVQLAQFREAALGTRDFSEEEDKFFYTVTSHVLGDRLYFVAHDKDASYTLCYGDADDIDPLTQWYIELVLILVGGVLGILFGAKIDGSRKKLLGIVKSIVRNPRVLTLFAKQITVNAIIEFFKILFNSGMLTDLLRAALAGFSFWKVAYMVAKMIALVAASAVGAWAVYAVRLATLVGELVYHLTKYPGKKEKKKEVQTLGLASVRFHHSLPGDATVRLNLEKWRAVPVPEWTSSNTGQSHAAYCLNMLATKNSWAEYALSGTEYGDLDVSAVQAVKIQASFHSSKAESFTKQVRCVNVSQDKILGDSGTVTVHMSGGSSVPTYVTFTFNAHRLAASGVRYVETEFEWQEKNSAGEWQVIARTKHHIYVILGQPQLPWSKTLFPWVEALRYSCKWAAGAVTKEDVAKKIVTQVNEALGLYYDIDSGDTSYVEEIMQSLGFNLTAFLGHLKNKMYSDVVNCMDCATICATFANAVGCFLSEKRMYTTVNEEGFLCNKIQAIGYEKWEVPFDGGFSYHEVCMMEPLQKDVRPSSVAENNYYVYDACLKLDASSTPGSDSGRIAHLPTGMHFSEYNDNVASVSNIPEYRSYREHLAANEEKGIEYCRYFYWYNNRTDLIYKTVI